MNSTQPIRIAIDTIHDLLSTDGASMDAAVAYMIRAELVKMESHVDEIDREQEMINEGFVIEHASDYPEELENYDESVAIENVGFRIQEFNGEDTIAREISLARENYGWNETPEWTQTMKDSKFVEMITFYRNRCYRRICTGANACYDFNRCDKGCELLLCSESHEKINFDESTIDIDVRGYIDSMVNMYPGFADYFMRYGYSYLGSGSTGIKERLDVIRKNWCDLNLI